MTVETWSTAAWREVVVEWIDAQLAEAGDERTGEVEQPHLRPWATVLRVPSSDGTVWFKAAGPGTAFEISLYELLSRSVPDRVLTPIAVDRDRAWILLPDGGPALGERLDGAELVESFVAAIVEYGRLQRALEPQAEEMLAIGVADMRPAVMQARLEEAVGAVTDAGGQEIAKRAIGKADDVARWCEQLEASPLTPSLDHNDLHPWNILGGDGEPIRYYDWGDGVLAHPFAAMLVPLGFVLRLLDAELDDPGFLRARDAYLEVFTDLAPHVELTELLETACRVAKIARVLTWERAVSAAREANAEIDEQWSAAPRETLASFVEESYLGGA